MQKLTSLAFALWALVTTVSAHGIIASPSQRSPGPAMKAACGETIFNNQYADNAGNIEGLLQYRNSIVDYSRCHIWQCKGYQFEDNKANVHSYSLGEVVPIKVKIVAPHTGFANVSIVDTASNAVKGGALISWADYASTATGVKPGDTDFQITIPSDLTGCTTAGECVIQWFWSSPEAKQSYESCIDFTIGGGSGGGPAYDSQKTADDYPVSSPTPTPTTTNNGDYRGYPNNSKTTTTPTGGCYKNRRRRARKY